MPFHHNPEQKSWVSIAFLALFSLSSQVLSVQYPIADEVDQNLPPLGSDTSHFPAWIRRRGFYDPTAQILCSGQMINDRVPDKFLQPGRTYRNNPRPSMGYKYYTVYGENVRAVCAKAAYGGSIDAWTAGGYCASGAAPPTVVFEKLPPEGAQMDEEVLKVFLLCQHSCRCVEGDYVDLYQQGRPALAIRREEAVENYRELENHPEDYQISRPIPVRSKLYSTNAAPPSSASSSMIPIYFIPEVDARRIGPGSSIGGRHGAIVLWAPPFNGYWAPECRGTFQGVGFDLVDATAQQMCAADWFGGSQRGNVGLVCLQDEMMFYSRMFAEPSVAHPVYRGVAINVGEDTIFKATMRKCLLACECKVPKKQPGSSQQKPRLVEGIFDAAMDWIGNIRRAGRSSGASTSLSNFGVQDLFPERETQNRQLRRSIMCRSNTVNGFDLSGSIAAQSLCRNRPRGYYRRRD